MMVNEFKPSLTHRPFYTPKANAFLTAGQKTVENQDWDFGLLGG